MTSKRRKWPYILGALLVIGVLAYPVGGNVLLRSGALEQIISKKPHKLKVAWSNAWTLWPGEVHIEGFRLDIHGKKSRIQVGIDKGIVQLNLMSLTGKTVDILSADVEGVEVSSTKRPKEELQRAENDETSRSSDAGSQAVESVSEGAASTVEQKKKKPWIIDLKGISAKGVRLVQLNKLKLVGDGILQELAMHLVTKGGPLRIDALELDMRADTAPDAGDRGHKSARVKVDVRMAENIPKQNKGKKLLKFLSGRVEVAGDASSIEFISALFGDKFNLSVAGGGRLDIVMIVESGELMDGSSINFNSSGLETDFLSLHAEGIGDIAGKIDKNLPIPASFRIRVKDFTLHRQGVPNPYMEGGGLKVELQATKFFLFKDMINPQLFVHFPDSTVRDLSDYNRFIPKQANIEIIQGTGHLRGTMSILGDSGHVNMELDATGVMLDVRDARIGTDFRLVANLAEGSYGDKAYNLTGTYFRMENTQLAREKDLTKDGWWGEIRIDKGDLIWDEPIDIDAEMRISMRDTEPLITLLRDTKKKKSFLDKALTIKNVEGILGIQTNEEDIILDPIQIKGKGLQVISRLDVLKKSINGVLYAKLHGIAANFEIENNKAKFKGLGGKKKVKKRVDYKRDENQVYKPRRRGNPHMNASKNML